MESSSSGGIGFFGVLAMGAGPDLGADPASAPAVPRRRHLAPRDKLMTALNGHNLSDPPPIPEPKVVIARQVWDAGLEDGDTPYDELEPDQVEQLENLAADYIGCHMKFLEKHGFRLLPPGAVLRPKSDQEAAAMEAGVRLYREAKGRKGGLLVALMNEFMRRTKVVPRVVAPERLGWVDSGEGWWTHRVTGQRYLPPPGNAWRLLVPPWVDDADLSKMAKHGGLEHPVATT